MPAVCYCKRSENINQVVQEVKLGQTGLIDEKQAIQAGRA
jgi:hypothetical protein